MNGEVLYKRLINREDLKDISLIDVMKVTIAVLQEISEDTKYEPLQF